MKQLKKLEIMKTHIQSLTISLIIYSVLFLLLAGMAFATEMNTNPPYTSTTSVENILFDEERFCFESFFWNKVIKQHKLTVFKDFLRIYYYDSGNQVSDELLSLDKAYRRFSDYKKFIEN